MAGCEAMTELQHDGRDHQVATVRHRHDSLESGADETMKRESELQTAEMPSQIISVNQSMETPMMQISRPGQVHCQMNQGDG